MPGVRPYRGDLVAWSGGSAFIGEGEGAVAPHAHHAIQLVVGAPSGLRVQFGRHGAWQSCAAALIPSRATHSIDIDGCAWSAVLLGDSRSAILRSTAARGLNEAAAFAALSFKEQPAGSLRLRAIPAMHYARAAFARSFCRSRR